MLALSQKLKELREPKLGFSSELLESLPQA
jgi:hypothetical protein